MAVDVLQHHDGIVHHQTDGQHQRQQREGVDREPKQGHEGKRANQRHRNSHERNDGCPEGAQKHKNHQRHQHHRFQNGLEHSFDGAVNEHRVVVGHLDFNAWWQVLLDARNHFAHRCAQVQRVGCGVADHAQRDGILAIQPGRRALGQWALLYPRHVTQAHRCVADRFDDHLPELGRGLQIGGGRDVELALFAFDAAGRHFQVGTPQGIFHVLGGEFERGQLVGIEPDAHGVLAFAKHPYIRCARRGLQHGFGNAVGIVGQLQGIQGVRTEGQPDHRERIGLNFGNHRLVNALWQALAHAADLVAHVSCG